MPPKRTASKPAAPAATPSPAQQLKTPSPAQQQPSPPQRTPSPPASRSSPGDAPSSPTSPISPLPGHRWRPDVLPEGGSPPPPEPEPEPAIDLAAEGSGLGFGRGGRTQLLVVRLGLACAVWGTLAVDLRSHRHRVWSALYTHWNLLLLAAYSTTALVSAYCLDSCTPSNDAN